MKNNNDSILFYFIEVYIAFCVSLFREVFTLPIVRRMYWHSKSEEVGVRASRRSAIIPRTNSPGEQRVQQMVDK